MSEPRCCSRARAPHALARALLGGAAALLAASAATPAAAADHSNIEEGLPIEVEDAFPIAYRGRELQGRFRYERQDGGEDQYLLEPRLELGVLPNAQVRIGSRFLMGPADRTTSRDVDLEGLYNFNQESVLLPAFALSARARFPTGVDSAGVDTRVKALATKTLGPAPRMERVHLNVAWDHEAAAGAGERSDRYLVVVGYSMRLDPDTILVADFVRQQEREHGADANIVEAGLRYQLTPQTVLVAGAGAGIGEESPDVRATVGFQHSLSWP
ncbi:MAG: hypothetical protein AB1689_12895 [Thermodesulfobacteriota bacterium]